MGLKAIEAVILQRGEDNAHEELTREGVVELCGFFDVALVIGKTCGNSSHDTRFIITVES